MLEYNIGDHITGFGGDWEIISEEESRHTYEQKESIKFYRNSFFLSEKSNNR